MAYVREERYMIRYALADGTEKVCYPKSEEKYKSNLAYCQENGIALLEFCKLYPFSTQKNQHNFDLIISICFNYMCEMERGEREWDEDMYKSLSEMRQDAEEAFYYELPVVWLPYEKWHRAKTLAQIAVSHREQACIENGRLDLLQYC